jgi:hypothetical protein
MFLSNSFENTILIIILCFIVAYIMYASFSIYEGMDSGITTSSSSSKKSGVGGGADEYATFIKNQVVHLQDTLLTDKYREKYESIVISLDDLVNNAMLTTALKIDPKNPRAQLDALVSMNQSKAALNAVMKFVGTSA